MTFKLSGSDLAFFDAKLKSVVEPDRFTVMVGASSKDIRLEGGFEL